MFAAIFKYEIKHWLRQPSTYIFSFIFIIIPWAIIWGMAGESTERNGGLLLNSPYNIHRMANYLNIFIYFLLPTFIGASVYRDYKNNVHTFFYSFPFTKTNYLFAKFLSAFTIVFFIVAMIGTGFFIGTLMPGTNPELLGDFKWGAYIQPYLFFLLPNLILIGGVVFAVVVLSRNIYAGFITVVILILVRAAFGSLSGGMDNQLLSALGDPLGGKALIHYTQYWTIAEKNDLSLPIKGVVIYNRLLWLLVSFGLLAWVYRKFSFSHHGISFGNKKNTEHKEIKANRNIQRINLPKVKYDFSFRQQIKTLWRLSVADFKFIAKSPLFISLLLASLLFIFFVTSMMNPRFDTEVYPVTWLILKLPTQAFSGIINLITFLFADLLIHRARIARTNQLIDVSPVSNWVLLFSKFLALMKIQAVLLALVMVGGMAIQIYHGYFKFEIGHYLFELYGLNLIHFMIWTCMALFIQSLFTNPYLGFFLLLTAPFGFIMLQHVGPEYLGLDFLEQAVFRYNQGPGAIFGLPYSDMDGYSAVLPSYFIYKIYWASAGVILLLAALLIWVRGLPQSFKERIRIAKSRFVGRLAYAMAFFIIFFLGMGFSLYYEGNVSHKYFIEKEKKTLFRKAEEKYNHFINTPQPKIVDVKINMDIFPEERIFYATGEYILVNKSQKTIDTLILNYLSNLTRDYHFNKKTTVVSKENIVDICQFDVLKLEEVLLPGDSLTMNFIVQNDAQKLLRTNNYVKNNGTLIKDDVFPRFGNWLGMMREMLHMLVINNKPYPSDSIALSDSYMSKDSDRINFSATVSTSKNQRAIAPGYLEKEWTENGRRYFQYKMDEKIAHSFLFMSGDYGHVQDKWNDIDLEIYYHKDHPYNLQRMMEGMKAGLEYCNKNFSPYQHKQLRIVEFSQSGGASAHAFPNTIPTGEEAGFIQHIHEGEDAGVDVVFGTAVHETAHQWWGHQVIPADVRGAKMIVESMAEYVNVKVKEKHRGIKEARLFLKHCLDLYLKGKSRERKMESPLMYTTPDQNYIHYAKGALALYAMSDYIGEDNLNRAIKNYVEKVAFQENIYTTSEELVDFIKKETPDSLQYLIKDLFETVTLYDNKIVDVKTTPLKNGQYQVDLEFNVSKYRSGEKGRKLYSENQTDSLKYVSDKTTFSLPLNDYIEIGIFGEKEINGKKEGTVLYLKKHIIQQINNKMTIVVDQLSTEVGIDPFVKLIDVNASDNRKKI